MEKIPKDLKRWLKDNGHYVEFIRLVTRCGYTVGELTYKKAIFYGKVSNIYDYGIKKWFNEPIDNKFVVIRRGGGIMAKYSSFLDELELNWK